LDKQEFKESENSLEARGIHNLWRWQIGFWLSYKRFCRWHVECLRKKNIYFFICADCKKRGRASRV